MKYLVTYEDTEVDSFGYDSNSGFGPGAITHTVTKNKLLDTLDKAKEFMDLPFVKDGNPTLYKCTKYGEQND